MYIYIYIHIIIYTKLQSKSDVQESFGRMSFVSSSTDVPRGPSVFTSTCRPSDRQEEPEDCPTEAGLKLGLDRAGELGRSRSPGCTQWSKERASARGIHIHNHLIGIYWRSIILFLWLWILITFQPFSAAIPWYRSPPPSSTALPSSIKENCENPALLLDAARFPSFLYVLDASRAWSHKTDT